MQINSSPGPRTGTHPLSGSRDPGERGALAPCSEAVSRNPGSPSIPIDLRLHVAADASMMDVVQFFTHLAESLGGYWEYHAPLSANPGRFEFHHLTFPHSETHS